LLQSTLLNINRASFLCKWTTNTYWFLSAASNYYSSKRKSRLMETNWCFYQSHKKRGRKKIGCPTISPNSKRTKGFLILSYWLFL